MSDRRYNAGKWVARLIAVVPPLALLVCISVYFAALKGVVVSSLPDIVASAAATSLHREVRLGPITVSAAFNHVVVRDLAISDAPTFAAGDGRKAASAERVDIELNPLALMMDPSSAAAYITQMSVTKPYAYVERLPNRKFNFSSLFISKRNPNAKPFTGRITVSDGSVLFRDRIAPAILQPAVNSLRNVRGYVSFAEPSAITFRASGFGRSNRASSVSVFGSVISRSTAAHTAARIAGYDVHIDANGANASYFTQYFLPGVTSRYAELTSGRADLSMTLSRREPAISGPLDIVGTAQVSGGTLVVRDRHLVSIPIDNIAGRIAFTNGLLAVDADGVLAGMPIVVNGNVPEFQNPYAAFRISAPSVNAFRLHGALPFIPSPPGWMALDSNMSVSASAIGPLAALQYNVAFSMPRASVYGTRLTGIRGGVRYQGHSLILDSLVGGIGGRTDTVQLHGSITTGSTQATVLRGRVRHLDLAKVHLPAQLERELGGLSGTVDADIDVSGAQPLSVVIAARMRSGSIHKIPVQEAVANLTFSGSMASVSRFNLIQPDGATLSAAGVLPIGGRSIQPYDLKVAAAGVDIGRIAHCFGRTGLSGSAYLRGTVTGSAAHPGLAGELSVFDAGYGKYGADHLRADIVLTPDRLSIANGSVNRLGVTAQVSGAIIGLTSKAPVVEAKIATHDAEIAGLYEVVEQAFAPQDATNAPNRGWLATATGSLNAEATIEGPLAHPRAALSATIATGSVEGVDVSKLTTKARYADNLFTIDDLSGSVAGAAVSAAGKIDLRTKSVQANMHATATDLSTVARLSGMSEPLSGSASCSVTASGTLSAPNLLFDASLQDVVYKHVQVSGNNLVLRYASGIVTNAGVPLVVTTGPATYRIESLRYDTRDRNVALKASIAGERLAALIATAREIDGSKTQAELDNVPFGADGALNVAELDVDGPIDSPAVRVNATVDGFTLGQSDQESLDFSVDAAYRDGTLDIASLEGRGRTEYLSASGTYSASGPLHARLDASNIPLSFLEPFAPGRTALGGEISDLTVIATGTAATPVLNASLSMTNVAIGSVTLDRIDSGRITLARNRIEIAGVTFTKSETTPGAVPIEHVATIRGSIPFVFSLKNGLTAAFPSNEPVSLTAQLPEQSMSLVSLFMPALRSDQLGGTIAAGLTIGGTLSDKIIKGSLAIKDGSIHNPAFKTEFRNINVNAVFDGSRGTITSTNIQSSAGGFLTVSGAISPSSQPHSARYATALDALVGNLQLNLAMHASDFTISEPKISALYNAGFQGVLNGDVTITQDLLHPLVSGSLQIAHGVGILPTIGENTAVDETAPEFNPRFDLAIAIQRGGRLRSSQIDSSADGTFDIGGSFYRPNITGDVYLRSGRFSFPTAIFRIVPTGVVHFVYNPPNNAVEQVNITATTELTISPVILAANRPGIGSQSSFIYQTPGLISSPGTLPQRYTVTLTIDGNLNSPNGLDLNFQSDPAGLTSSEILAAMGGQQALNTLLVGGNVQLALQTEAQQILTSYAIPTLLQPVEANIASAFGVEEFDVNYEPQSPLTISVTKQLSPRLEVSYTRYVNSRVGGAVSSTLEPLEYTVAADYYFTNRFRIGVSTDDQHNYEIEIGGAFRF